jgi:hypothetical protein
MINQRTGDGENCPYCGGKRGNETNSLTKTHPHLAKEWHPTKNGDITSEKVGETTRKEYWWLCENGNDWEDLPNSRRSIKCKFCKK